MVFATGIDRAVTGPGRYNLSRQDVVLVVVISLAALLLRLLQIGDASLWTDEGYSLWFSRQPLGALWGDIARNEYNPTLYYILLNGWMSVFGESAAAMRSLSATLNAATIPLVYLTARWTVRSSDASLVATLSSVLFALAFAELQYAQEARTYTLCVLAMSIVLAASVRITGGVIDVDTGAASSIPRWPFVMLAVGGALALWGHYSSLIFLALIGAFHLFLLWRAADHRQLLSLRYALAGAVFLVIGGRALWLMLAYALPASDNFWIAVPSPSDVIDATSIIFGGALAMDSWSLEVLTRILLFAPWPLLGAFALWQRGEETERLCLALFILSSIVAFSAYLAVTYLGKPVFLQRVVLSAQLGWVVMCGACILAFRDKQFRAIAASLLVAAFSASALSYVMNKQVTNPKEPWKEIAARIAKESAIGETVFVTATSGILISHYLAAAGRTDLNVTSINGAYRTPPARSLFASSGIRYTTPISPELAEDFAEALAQTDTSWIILRNPDSPNWELVRPVIENTNPEFTLYQPGPLGVYRIAPGADAGTSLARGSE